MRLPVRAWSGVVALVGSFALFALAHLCLAPRQKVALDIPLRIASGHASTGPFVIRDDEYEGYVAEIVFARAARDAARLRAGWRAQHEVDGERQRNCTERTLWTCRVHLRAIDRLPRSKF
jgi:hypothetical protein